MDCAVQDLTDEAPHTVDVPASEVHRVIGSNGSIIKGLIRTIGCHIDVPRGSCDSGAYSVSVRLDGPPGKRRMAASVIRDIVAGGDAADHIEGAQGAMLLSHCLEDIDRRSWLAWRLVPVEYAFGLRVELGRRSVRLWTACGGRHLLQGAKADQVRDAVEAAVVEARGLIELGVLCGVDFDAENADRDAATIPLVDAFGVLVRPLRPEGGLISVKIVGPVEAARDLAELIEARFAKGRYTGSVLQLPGQVQAMLEPMATDFRNDVEALEREFSVKVHLGKTILWVCAGSADAAASARRTLREMMQFYLPNGTELVTGFKSESFVKLRQDPGLRHLAPQLPCAISFEAQEGSLWVCGTASARGALREHVDTFMRKWSAENWDLDLPDYGAAMWLLGPRGSGEYLQRIQRQSGAHVSVCPNSLKVWADGMPACVKEAERLVREALEQLEVKRMAEDEKAPLLKPKTLLSEHPPAMHAILEKLAELDEKRRVEKQMRLRMEREREWSQQPVEAAIATGTTQDRRRSRSRSHDRVL